MELFILGRSRKRASLSGAGNIPVRHLHGFVLEELSLSARFLRFSSRSQLRTKRVTAYVLPTLAALRKLVYVILNALIADLT